MSILDSDALFAEVMQQLRAAMQDDRAFNIAQMHLINLPEVISEAGSDWPLLKDRIRASSVHFLRGCLNETDLVIPAGDGFIIIFADGDADEQKARTEDLRLLLLEFYLGQDGLRRIKVAASERQMHARELRAMLAPPPSPQAPLDLVSHVCMFLPLWSARAKVIGSYLCTPVREGAKTIRFGYDAGFAETGENEHRDYCALDLQLLDIVQEALDAQAESAPRPVLIASVHVTTMQNRRARATYLERLSKVPADYLRHIVVRIAEIEAGVPNVNLADWAGLLRAYAPHVLLEFHGSTDTPPDLSPVGVWGAGFQADSARPLPVQARQLKRWAEALAAQRLHFVADNLGGPDLAALAAEAGAHFISSPAVWPAAPHPGPVIRADPFPSVKKSVSSAQT